MIDRAKLAAAVALAERLEVLDMSDYDTQLGWLSLWGLHMNPDLIRALAVQIADPRIKRDDRYVDIHGTIGGVPVRLCWPYNLPDAPLTVQEVLP